MSITVEEKMDDYQHKREVAEKHFFDAGQPHFPLGFSICNRNKGHWDIYAEQAHGKASAFLALNDFTSSKDGERERAFRIRGEVPNVTVYDERWNPYGNNEVMPFKSVMGAMLYICEELMQEQTNE